MVWHCNSALGKGSSQFCDGSTDAEKYIEISEQYIPLSRWYLFQGRPYIFQQDMAILHYAHITNPLL